MDNFYPKIIQINIKANTYANPDIHKHKDL